MAENKKTPNRYIIQTVSIRRMTELMALKGMTGLEPTSDNQKISFNRAETTFILNKTWSEIVENALFYQLLRIKNPGKSEKDFEIICEDRNSLFNDVIYADFKGVFGTYLNPDLKEERDAEDNEEEKKKAKKNKTVEEADDKQIIRNADLAKLITRKGFTLTFPSNDGAENVEVPFSCSERSGSMARNCRMCFVNADYKKALDEAIHVGITPKQVNIAKKLAYDGLIMSSGIRIPGDEKHIFDQDSVIVVNDYTSKYKIKGKECESNLFDGEGFVSPEFAEYFRSFLEYDEKDAADKPTSFQIRIPYIKGMLHECDFERFARDKIDNIALRTGDNIRIKDAFEIERDLSKVHIILTVSQFKALKWLNQTFKNMEKEEFEKIQPYVVRNDKGEAVYDKNGKIIYDKMKYYFEYFDKYKHALYIIGNNHKPARDASGRSYVNLNYQVLSTPDLSYEDFIRLGSPTLEIYKDLMGNELNSKEEAIKKRIDALLGNKVLSGSEKGNTEIDENKEIDPDETYGFNKVINVVRAYPQMISSGRARRVCLSKAENILADYGQGKFFVEGQNLYLSGDLMALLCHIFEIESNNKPKEYDFLEHEMFFAPGLNVKDKKLNNTSMALLRNPHISRKELIKLKYYKGSEERNNYLGHLKGVVMIKTSPVYEGKKSEEAKNIPLHERLSGADFDGDMVKIIAEPAFNKAIADDCLYTPMTAIEHLPAASDIDVNSDKYYDELFKTLKLSFGNKVGLYSNYAFKHAVHAYNKNNTSEEQDEPQCEKSSYEGDKQTTEFRYKRYTPEAVDRFTEVIGQEIDSAKTGKKPKVEKELCFIGENGESKKLKDYFLSWKDNCQVILKATSVRQPVVKELEGADYREQKFDVIIKPNDKTKMPNLYALPYLTLSSRFSTKLRSVDKDDPNAEEKEYLSDHQSIAQLKPEKSQICKDNKISRFTYLFDLIADKYTSVKEGASNSETQAKFKAIVARYSKLISSYNYRCRFRKQSDSNSGYANTDEFSNKRIMDIKDQVLGTLFLKYKNVPAAYSCFLMVLSRINRYFTRDKIDEFRKMLVKDGKDKDNIEWIFAEKTRKEEILNKISDELKEKDKNKEGLSSVEFNMLSNFSYGGFKLLPLLLDYAALLKDISFDTQDNPSASSADSSETNDETESEYENNTEDSENEELDENNDDDSDVNNEKTDCKSEYFVEYDNKDLRLFNEQNRAKFMETLNGSADREFVKLLCPNTDSKKDTEAIRSKVFLYYFYIANYRHEEKTAEKGNNKFDNSESFLWNYLYPELVKIIGDGGKKTEVKTDVE